jgi:inosose dehydratase
LTLRVANAPCSWGALEFEWAGTMPPYAKVLDEMASTGYAGTELGRWGFMPTEPATLRDELTRRRLALLGAFVPVRLTVEDDHRAGSDAAVRVARLLEDTVGDSGLVVLADDTARDPVRTKIAGRVTPEHMLDESGWTTLAAGANRIAQDVQSATGLRTVFHHHCATFVETPAEIDELMSRTDPSLVGLCLDTGHCTFGGGDPLKTLDRWRDRVWHVHLKDCDPAIRQQSAREQWDYAASVRHGVFCELGQGQVDFRGILARLAQTSYAGWLVVEQDVLPSMGTPAESAARNRRYLQSLGV